MQWESERMKNTAEQLRLLLQVCNRLATGIATATPLQRSKNFKNICCNCLADSIQSQTFKKIYLHRTAWGGGGCHNAG